MAKAKDSVDALSELEKLRERIKILESDLKAALEENQKLRWWDTVLTALIDSVPAMMWVKEANGRIVCCNAAYARSLDCTTEELIGTSAYERYTQEEKEQARSADRQVICQSKPIEMVETFTRGGKVRHFLTLKAPIQLKQEICIACVSIDQTANILSQQTMHDDLVRHEQTIELRDRLLMILGHDIRSPISILVECCEEIEDPESEITREDINVILKSVGFQSKSLLEMIDNMLTWVRTQQQNLTPRFHAVDIREMAARSRDLYSRMLGEKCIKFDISDEGPVTAFSDEDMLNIILRNLISNAIKFTPKGGLIKVDREYYGDSKLLISVTDNGVGISPEKAQEMNVSESLKKTTGTNDEPGFGLGLSLCRDLAARLNGEIRFDSLKQGTRASIIIPRIDLESNLYRLIYRSEAVDEFSEKDLVDLSEMASSRNSAAKVSGVLLYRRGIFIQMMEGHHSVVDEIYKRIVKDGRHHRILLLQNEPIERKLFPNWEMKLFHGDERADFSEFLDLVDPDAHSDRTALEMIEALFRFGDL